MIASRIKKTPSIFLALVFFVTGCAATPPPPPPVLPLAPTASRLLLLRPYNILSMRRVALVTINGVDSCGLANGKAFVKDVAPGAVTITGATTKQFLFQPDLSKLNFTAVAGQSYYVEFTPSGEGLGAFGALIDMSAQPVVGPFNIFLAGQADLGEITPVGCAR